MENFFLYLLLIVVPLAIVAAATVLVRSRRQDLKYQEQARERRTGGPGGTTGV